MEKIHLQMKEVVPPKKDQPYPVPLTDQTMRERKEKVLAKMRQRGLDTLIIYNDLEHGGNFAYLTGFMTRFEEGLLILHQSGKAYLVLGNENLKMAAHSRIEAELLHVPMFSLPNQPMDGEDHLTNVLKKAGVQPESRVGLVGWKLLQSTDSYDLPHLIVEAVQKVVKEGTIEQTTGLFIDPASGTRILNNANEVAHYAFGSALASNCVLEALEAIAVGKTEMEIGDHLVRYGQKPTVVPIAATGERFAHAAFSPTAKEIQLGDKFSLTTGFVGGLASRSGYVVAETEQLPADQQDYLEKVAFPYYRAVVTWLETLAIGKTGGEIYEAIESVLPKETYHWHLNPGHLTAEEEWLSSPMTESSTAQLRSGMLLQLDIIPSVAGYVGASCENGIALADEELQKEIQVSYPELWTQIQQRRTYIIEVLGIDLPTCVLPLSSGVAYCTPYFLAKNQAIIIKK